MINYENVSTMEKSELKNITFDNTTFDAATVAHLVKISKIAKALTDEVNKHKDIVKAHEDAFLSNKLVDVEHKESPHIDKDAFIAEFGEDTYKRFLKVSDAKTVTFG